LNMGYEYVNEYMNMYIIIAELWQQILQTCFKKVIKITN
jgi:hypothetical protein